MAGRKRRGSEKRPASGAGGAATVQRAGGGGKSLPLWLSSLVLILSGYIMLTKADPAGQNGWAVASPAALLAGYLLIIPAIFATYSQKN